MPLPQRRDRRGFLGGGTMKKDFDCVEMKNRIQAQLLDAFKGLTPEEERELRRKMIAEDPILSHLLSMKKRPDDEENKG
jgi:hypothetical protein